MRLQQADAWSNAPSVRARFRSSALPTASAAPATAPPSANNPVPLEEEATRENTPAALRTGRLAWVPKDPHLARLAAQLDHLPALSRRSTAPCVSGLSLLDAALGGGFATSAVHELLAPAEGAPALSLAFHVAARAALQRPWVVHIDTSGTFYPPAVTQCGLTLAQLLVIRARRTADVLWVSEQVLRCRAVAALVVPLPNLSPQASRRLQLAAEAGQGLGLFVRPAGQLEHTFAATRLRCTPLATVGRTRRLEISVLKNRAGRPLQVVTVELPHAPAAGAASAVPGDRSDRPAQIRSG